MLSESFSSFRGLLVEDLVSLQAIMMMSMMVIQPAPDMPTISGIFLSMLSNNL